MNPQYDYLMSWLGTPYIWGGQSRLGVDCSGLAQLFLASIGLDPPGDQTAQSLYDHFLDKSHDFKRFGALVFFGKNERLVSHCGILVDPLTMIEARGGDRTTLTVTPGASVELSPLSRRKDFLKVLYPFRG